ncbi:MAG TPA: hypothetical protein VHR66_14515 [Gemmataceae bacterium]|jgi:hypothetical protein|nr:hypothetical protein [Gemmataceae bacterium]
MDRSFLSRPAVIAASRDFVCVRLATYEDPLEAKFLKSLVRTGSGEVENTGFCLLAPDGKKRLSRSARGMDHLYADAAEMAAEMTKIAGTFKPIAVPSALPLAADARLGLDIAAADGLPLVIVVGPDATSRKPLVDRMAKLGWTDEFIGRFIYAEGTAKDVVGVPGVTIDAGIVVIAPDKFGQKGTALRQINVDMTIEKTAESLRLAAKEYQAPAKTFQNHVREGQRLGVFWETKLPVTDPMENNARERGKRMAQPKN